jgi:hypothetical protein
LTEHLPKPAFLKTAEHESKKLYTEKNHLYTATNPLSREAGNFPPPFFPLNPAGKPRPRS